MIRHKNISPGVRIEYNNGNLNVQTKHGDDWKTQKSYDEMSNGMAHTEAQGMAYHLASKDMSRFEKPPEFRDPKPYKKGGAAKKKTHSSW
jgi:hypothetical protein